MGFNQELFNKIAKEFAIPETLKTAIMGGEGVPEDFDAKESIENYLSERENFYKDKFRNDIVEEYKNSEGKDAYLATMKPVSRRIIKLGDITEEQMKDVDITDAKTLIEIAQKNFEKKLEEKGKSTNATLQSELTEMREKYASLYEDHNSLKDQYDSGINSAKEEKERSIRQFKVEQKFLETLNSSDFDWTQSPARVAKWMRSEMEELGYKVDFDAAEKDIMIQAADGTKAFTLDGKDQYKDLKTAINDFGARLNLFKKSNGGEGDTIHKPGERKIAGKVVSNESVDFLKAAMAGE